MTDVLPSCLAAAKTYSVLVSDPDLSVRSALAAVIGAAPGLDLVGEAADGEETLTRAAEAHPDLVVMGAGTAGANLAGVTGRLVNTAGPPKVVVLAAPEQAEQGRDALRAGASGLLLRGGPASDLLTAVPAVAAGHVLVAPAFATQLTGRHARRDTPSALHLAPVKTWARPGHEPMRRAVAADNRLFARDIHDVLGRTLAAINRKGELVARLLTTQPERALAELETVLLLTRRSMAEVRALAGGYRLGDLATEIEGVRSDLEVTGTRVEVVRTRDVLPRPVQEVFGWVVREAAANIIRHSEAGRCSIEVWTGPRSAHLRVTNDGAGQAVSASGTGLAGLTARLHAVGGTLTHGPGPDASYRVEATVPLSRSDWGREHGDQGCPGRGRSPHQGGSH
ncbi:signal transduction histidine kinase [Streptomyces glaucescens]|jgi:signal transduction histidine kinase